MTLSNLVRPSANQHPPTHRCAKCGAVLFRPIRHGTIDFPNCKVATMKDMRK